MKKFDLGGKLNLVEGSHRHFHRRLLKLSRHKVDSEFVALPPIHHAHDPVDEKRFSHAEYSSF